MSSTPSTSQTYNPAARPGHFVKPGEADEGQRGCLFVLAELDQHVRIYTAQQTAKLTNALIDSQQLSRLREPCGPLMLSDIGL